MDADSHESAAEQLSRARRLTDPASLNETRAKLLEELAQDDAGLVGITQERYDEIQRSLRQIDSYLVGVRAGKLRREHAQNEDRNKPVSPLWRVREVKKEG